MIKSFTPVVVELLALPMLLHAVGRVRALSVFPLETLKHTPRPRLSTIFRPWSVVMSRSIVPGAGLVVFPEASDADARAWHPPSSLKVVESGDRR